MATLPDDWARALNLPPSHLAHIDTFLDHAYATEDVLPPRDRIYTALELCPFHATRVVILGQDPYPTPGHAHGLAFSVNPSVRLPGSLRNIFKEITADLGTTTLPNGDLRPWAQQGVLLLNTILTVRAHAPLSHANCGWEPLTDAILHTLAHTRDHLVFMLWGAKAQAKATLIPPDRHLILRAPHPSPLSARTGFFGSHPFSQANTYLLAHNTPPIHW